MTISDQPAAGLPANAEAIRFDHVSVEFRTRHGEPVLALDSFDLSVAQGEFVSLVGPSGCGKSTALRLVAQLTEATKGQVRVAGAESLRGFSRVALVFQSPNLLPWKTVIDNVLYPVRFGSPVAGIDHRARARELLALVGLERFENAYPSELSGGMQQRVAICRSLVLDPKILLMDEPFSALDALTREELQFELRRIHRHTGKTILFVTHSISESVLLADRIVVMAPRPGRLKDSFVVELAPDRTPATLHDPRFAQYSDRVREGIYGRAAA
ncbi:ABC transporter ATP-binding protein [Mesorhizobium sp. J428]|uniref:ABC transporter ATP-binding protein n=1 Tax=Mesorhizobium sp. J428 TaxID=2898440 RepID=UPI002150D30F|nr:ABC transporter ATP-binding protein [Mesorhizobium sp. J428]MCR5857238.1 ABC transporter ATP-binding protein [Mesorhizobium sp. J428]